MNSHLKIKHLFDTFNNNVSSNNLKFNDNNDTSNNEENVHLASFSNYKFQSVFANICFAVRTIN